MSIYVINIGHFGLKIKIHWQRRKIVLLFFLWSEILSRIYNKRSQQRFIENAFSMWWITICDCFVRYKLFGFESLVTKFRCFVIFLVIYIVIYYQTKIQILCALARKINDGTTLTSIAIPTNKRFWSQKRFNFVKSPIFARLQKLNYIQQSKFNIGYLNGSKWSCRNCFPSFVFCHNFARHPK